MHSALLACTDNDIDGAITIDVNSRRGVADASSRGEQHWTDREPSGLICENTAECDGFCGKPEPTTPSTILKPSRL